jgi:monofunctional biosynthetic peptidoglycan transglycosylase
VSRKKLFLRASLWGLAAVLVAAALFWVTLPPVGRLRTENPPTTAFMERRKEELRRTSKSDALDRIWVPLEKMSPHLLRAVVAGEDSRFWEHGGIDLVATWGAAKEAFRRGKSGHRPRRGGSTITQQLAKNLFLGPERSYWRKIREAGIALELERTLSKRRILEIYLNSIEWGGRTWGAEAAARRYFGKGASSLSPSEAAFLVAMIPGPRKALNPAINPARVARRQRKILALMASTATPPPSGGAEEDDEEDE